MWPVATHQPSVGGAAVTAGHSGQLDPNSGSDRTHTVPRNSPASRPARNGNLPRRSAARLFKRARPSRVNQSHHWLRACVSEWVTTRFRESTSHHRACVLVSDRRLHMSDGCVAADCLVACEWLGHCHTVAVGAKFGPFVRPTAPTGCREIPSPRRPVRNGSDSQKACSSRSPFTPAVCGMGI